MADQINYSDAFEELQRIVTEIEHGEISVDELSQKVKRATELIKICKTKLTTTEEDVNKILKDLELEIISNYFIAPPFMAGFIFEEI